jgi:hypothetical protein
MLVVPARRTDSYRRHTATIAFGAQSTLENVSVNTKAIWKLDCSHTGMEAVITKVGPGNEIQSCGIAGCAKAVAYHLVKIRDNQSEEETFFCAAHGEEYATRGHLAISEAA